MCYIVSCCILQLYDNIDCYVHSTLDANMECKLAKAKGYLIPKGCDIKLTLVANDCFVGILQG